MRTLGYSGLMLIAALGAAHAASPIGEWLVDDDGNRVRVVNCPPNLWGVISYEMKPGTDSKNPDPALKNRPMMGAPILHGLKQTSANLWEGKIYDPRDGSFYNSKVSLDATGNVLQVRGCLAIFCGGRDWPRYVNPAAANAKMTTAPATAKSAPPKAQASPAPAPKMAAKAAPAAAPAKPVDFTRDPDAAVCAAIPEVSRPATQ
jgi:uncharacterized protein (DUF2147 family)